MSHKSFISSEKLLYKSKKGGIRTRKEDDDTGLTFLGTYLTSFVTSNTDRRKCRQISETTRHIKLPVSLIFLIGFLVKQDDI